MSFESGRHDEWEREDVIDVPIYLINMLRDTISEIKEETLGDDTVVDILNQTRKKDRLRQIASDFEFEVAEANRRRKLEEAARARANEARRARAFRPAQEGLFAKMSAQFPELGDANLRNLFTTVIDSLEAGVSDEKVFRALVKKYHPDTAPEERRDVYGRIIGVITNLYDSKTKRFILA
jgi:hypothetical protein